jgi:hypothetical protein
MAGSSWLAGALAAVMIVIALYCASRLVASRLWRRETEYDADGLHVAMGTAMAGMLVPRLSPLPDSAWEVVFGVAAAWFAWQAARTRRGNIPGGWRCPYPVPHLVECAAMLYMLLAPPGPRSGGPGPGMPMPGMGGSPGAAGSFPALVVVLALFMLGYIAWTTDRLTALTRARAAVPAPGTAWDRTRPLVTPGAHTATSPHDATGTPATSSAAGSWHGQGGSQVLAPRLAASYKIAMSITMGYMLIQML